MARSVGDLVFPANDKYWFGLSGIALCEEKNRERPAWCSELLSLGTPILVIERHAGRFPMLRVVTVSSDGAPRVGWVLESDTAKE